MESVHRMSRHIKALGLMPGEESASMSASIKARHVDVLRSAAVDNV